MKKNFLSRLAFGMCIFGMVGMGNAEVISFNIQGNITKVYDNEGYINASISEGDTFTGTLTYDTAKVDSEPNTGFGRYEYDSVPNGISVTINGLTFQTDPEDVNFQILVVDVGPAGDEFYATSSSENSFPVVPTNPYERIEWHLSTDPSYLPDDSLPTTLDLSSWCSTYCSNLFYIQSGEAGAYTTPDYRIEGTITAISLHSIPQPPVADAGTDQIIFDEILLDASRSDDSDGTISLFDWQLQHRENSAYNKTAEGINPTVSDLNPGFYDVTLTVTDNDGESDTDVMMFGAIGCKGDFNSDGDVDGSDLAEFAVNFGRTNCPACQ